MAIWDKPVIVAWGLILAFVTDIADGLAARMLGQVSDFGAKFDSFADNLLYPSVLGWLALLKPRIFTEHLLVIGLTVLIQAASKAFGLVKFRRFWDLQLYSARVAGYAWFAFVLHTLLLSPNYSHAFFWLAISLCILAFTETLVIQVMRPEGRPAHGIHLLARTQIGQPNTTNRAARRVGERGSL